MKSIDETIKQLEAAYAAAQKSGNAKRRNAIFQQLQKLKSAGR